MNDLARKERRYVPTILSKTYFPSHDENRMRNEGDVKSARNNFLQNRFRNLEWLLRSRYEWMNEYINANDVVYEIGCGAGFSPLYLKVKPILTDIIENEWVDKIIDAQKMDIEDCSIDVLIASNNIHHFATPFNFFNEALRVLKPSGRLIIQEINTSLCMRILLRIMRHEGWSYEPDVFDKTAIVNDPRDPWSANCAVPQMLFNDTTNFEEKIKNEFGSFKFLLNNPCEFLLFPVSGGVIAKTKVPELPAWLLNAIESFDSILTKLAPNFFALERQVVLQKVPQGA